MNKLFAAALLAALAGCVAPQLHGVSIAQHGAAGPAVTGAMPGWPSPREPLDATPITPVESAGASGTE